MVVVVFGLDHWGFVPFFLTVYDGRFFPWYTKIFTIANIILML